MFIRRKFNFGKIVLLLMLSIFINQHCLALTAEHATSPVPLLNKEIQNVTNKPIYKHANWGIVVKDLNSGKVIYEQNINNLFTPGSTTKLFTVAAALQTLGANYRYETYVYQNGKLDANGVLNGDIILVASGDLTMGGRKINKDKIAYTDFDHTDANALNITDKFLLKYDPTAGLDDLAKQIAAKGIKTIAGEVLIDDRLFEKSTNPEDKNLMRTPIVINDNIIDFVVKPGKAVGEKAVFTWRPQNEYYRIDAQIQTVAKGKPTWFSEKIIDPNKLVMRGQISIDAPAFLKIYNVDDPASFARSLFITALQKNGITLDSSPLAPNPGGKLPPKNFYAKLPKIAELISPPLSENAKLILKVSHNLGAELLPLQIAVKNSRSTFEAGLELEKKLLNQLGVDTDAISISDGSGLSRADLFTPNVVTQLLEKIYNTHYFKAYYDALPILGVDGTLAEDVSANSIVRGKVRAKTGTMVNTDLLNQRAILLDRSIAGYIDIGKNKPLVFAIYVNNVAMAQPEQLFAVAKDLGQICEIIYKHEKTN